MAMGASLGSSSVEGSPSIWDVHSLSLKGIHLSSGEAPGKHKKAWATVSPGIRSCRLDGGGELKIKHQEAAGPAEEGASRK